MKKNFDNHWLGATIAVIATLVSVALIIKYRIPYDYMHSFFKEMLIHVVVPSVISLGVIPNLAFFFLFIYTDRYKSAKGVLGATIVFAIIVFILKLSK